VKSPLGGEMARSSSRIRVRRERFRDTTQKRPARSPRMCPRRRVDRQMKRMYSCVLRLPRIRLLPAETFPDIEGLECTPKAHGSAHRTIPRRQFRNPCSA
jgi:hypothetical protein